MPALPRTCDVEPCCGQGRFGLVTVLPGSDDDGSLACSKRGCEELDDGVDEELVTLVELDQMVLSPRRRRETSVHRVWR